MTELLASEEYINKQLKTFNLTDAAIAELSKKCMPMIIDGIEDKNGYEAVKLARKSIKSYRVEVEHKRKELNADALKYQRAINEEAKRIIGLLVPIENHLSLQEDIFETEKERIKKEKEEAEKLLLKTRVKALTEIGFMFDGEFYFSDFCAAQFSLEGLKIISDELFMQSFRSVTDDYQQYKAKKDAEQKAKDEESKRLESIAKEKSDREAMELKKQLEDIDRQRKEQEAERLRLESIAKEQEEREAALDVEAIRIEVAKIKQEKESKILPDIIIQKPEEAESINSEEELSSDKSEDLIATDYSTIQIRTNVISLLEERNKLGHFVHLVHRDPYKNWFTEAHELLKEIGEI